MSFLWDQTFHFPNLIATLQVSSSALCEITLTTFHIWIIHHVRTTACLSCVSINTSVLIPLLHRDASISVFCDILLTVAHVCYMTIHTSVLISFLHRMPPPVLLWHPTKHSTCLSCVHTHQCSNLYATMNDSTCAFVIILLNTAHVCHASIHTNVLISMLQWMTPPVLLW
jgi:hypothetical protein